MITNQGIESAAAASGRPNGRRRRRHERGGGLVDPGVVVVVVAEEGSVGPRAHLLELLSEGADRFPLLRLQLSETLLRRWPSSWPRSIASLLKLILYGIKLMCG